MFFEGSFVFIRELCFCSLSIHDDYGSMKVQECFRVEFFDGNTFELYKLFLVANLLIAKRELNGAIS